MHTRLARLADTQSISALFQAQIHRWQRLNTDGRVEDLPYTDLSLYERWLHGGAWMSVETAVLWLSHLIRGAGVPIVLMDEQERVIGYTEAFAGDETPPFGKHLHLEHLHVSDNDPASLEQLLDAILQEGQKYGRVLVTCSAFDHERLDWYQAHGFVPFETVQRYHLSTQSGQGFYKVTDHPHPDSTQIRGWGLPIGRTHSARHAWETLWTALWDAVPEIAHEPIHRLKMSASGQEAFLCVQPHRYDQRTVDVYCWSQKTVSAQLLVAIRDWAHRQHYRNLVLWGQDSLVKVLPADVEVTPHQQIILTREV